MPTTSPRRAGEAQVSPRPTSRWIVLLPILVGPFLVVLDGFALNIALPSIQNGLRASDAALQLVVAGYAVAYGACLVTGGRLGDIYGQKTVLLVGLVAFSLTSLLGALAPNQYVLVGARFLQGVAAAVLYPQTLALVRLNFQDGDLDRALSIFGITLGVAAVVAQLAGGLLVQADVGNLTWRPILMINVPICAVAGVLAAALVPGSGISGPARLDMTGLTMATAALAMFVLPLVVGRQLVWPLWTWPALGLSGLILLQFVRYELRLVDRGGSPLIALEPFKVRGFVIGLVVTLLFYAAEIPFFLVLTLYLQRGLRLSPLAAGLTFVPLAVGFAVASLTNRAWHALLGRHALPACAWWVVACMFSLAVLVLRHGEGRAQTLALASSMLAMGLGLGTFIPSLLTAILRTLPALHAGSGAGVLVTAQQVGGAVGVALLGLVFFGLQPTAAAFAAAVGCGAVLFGAAALLVRTMDEG